MLGAVTKAAGWALVTMLFLLFGLELIGWGFYELSHLFNIEWTYKLYSIFRGAGYFIGEHRSAIWIYSGAACITGSISFFLSKRKMLKAKALVR